MSGLMSFKGMTLDFGNSDIGSALTLVILMRDKIMEEAKRKGLEYHIRKELEMSYGIDDITENEDALIEYQSAIAALSEEEIPEYIDEDVEVFPIFSNGSVVSAPLYFQTADSNKRYSLSDISHTIAGSTNGPMSFMEADIVRYFIRVRKLNPAYEDKEDWIEVIATYNAPGTSFSNVAYYTDRQGNKYGGMTPIKRGINKDGKSITLIKSDSSIQKRNNGGSRYVQLYNNITHTNSWHQVPDGMQLTVGSSIDLTQLGPPLNNMPLGGQIMTL